MEARSKLIGLLIDIFWHREHRTKRWAARLASTVAIEQCQSIKTVGAKKLNIARYWRLWPLSQVLGRQSRSGIHADSDRLTRHLSQQACCDGGSEIFGRSCAQLGQSIWDTRVRRSASKSRRFIRGPHRQHHGAWLPARQQVVLHSQWGRNTQNLWLQGGWLHAQFWQLGYHD